MAYKPQNSSQLVNRAALPMVGSAANATASTILPLIDAEIAKLFEDRNIFLTDGGLITFTGTQLQFTENLNLAINSRIAGGSPVIISLGSANINLNNGDMWYAVINRTGGTATTFVVSSATGLPAVNSTNEEIFLIAKRDDAGDGTQRVYFRSGTALNAGQTVRLGAAGSGTGTSTGSGSDLDSLLYRASWIDRFPEPPNGSTSGINGSAGFTNATYNTSKTMYVINYDATKTVTTTGTAATISGGSPSFTVVAGDVLFLSSTGEVKKIVTVTTQTSYVLESGFALNQSGAPVTISQAVYSKDVYNTTIDGVPLADAFNGATFQEILIDYEDNATPGSNLWTPNVPAFVAYTASSDDSVWTTSHARVTNETDTALSLALPSAGTSLWLRFYSNKVTGSGIVNLLMYEAFMQRDNSLLPAFFSIGALNGQSPNANGLSFNSNVLYAQSASATFPGLVDTATQTFAGDKTFTGTTSTSTLNASDNITITKANNPKIQITASTGTNRVLGLSLTNGGGNSVIGLETSTGGSITIGGSPYALAIQAPPGKPIELAYNNGTGVALRIAGSSNATSVLGTFEVVGTLSADTSILMPGSSSGTVTIQTQAAAGTYNFNLPTTAGTAGQVLTSGGGGASPMTWGSGLVYRAGNQSVGSASTSQAITFSSTIGTTGYAISAQFVNTTDSSPQFQPITITAQSATGFTAMWNDPTDTANYSIQYTAMVNQ